MTMRAATVAVGVAASLAALPAWAQGTINVPSPPPADQPLVKSVPKPKGISIDGGAGVLGYVSGTGRLGPAWNVRVTADFTPRWALEGDYVGASNSRSDNTGTLTYNSVSARVRYNILRPDEAPVQPFLTGGLGWAGWIGPGGTPASLVIPFAVGAERQLTERIKVGARLDVRPAFFDDLGHGYEKSTPGGSTWAIIANVGGGF